MKTLAGLFADFPLSVISGSPDETQIEQIRIDSRQVEVGDLFVATKGRNLDSHRFISQAVQKGAAAVVGMDDPPPDLVIPYIQVENSRQALAYLAAALYDHPAQKLTVIGVTGTDGKTTTCNLLYQILQQAGFKTGMISTVNAIIGTEVLDTGFHVTTPDAPAVQKYLAQMVAAGLTHVILETTSHGWAQYRVDACEMDIAVVTNITHEHLDEHGSYENYRAAKARLFESLRLTKPKAGKQIGLAVLNKDDSSFNYLSQIGTAKSVTYGITSDAILGAADIADTPSGLSFTVSEKNWTVPVKCQLAGAFNVANCLAAFAAAVYGLQIAPQIAAEGISKLQGIPGRMERIYLGQNFTTMVDFAHTPNALKNALEAARALTTGRVIVIFGSAGLRDREKRRLMAEIAAEFADFAILTAEDPRAESLENILAEMAAGAEKKGGVEGENFWRVPDRGAAIRYGLTLAEAGDVVLACGKGHEQSMCFGQVEYPWYDRVAMRAALADYLGVLGPQMPELPTEMWSGGLEFTV